MTEAVIFATLAGLFGLLIGSFLNVCIYRLPRDLSVVHPRSQCPHCERLIAWYDNIPVLSYVLLHARCRHCKASISWIYPVVEITTGVFFFCSVYLYGWNLLGLKFCVFSAIMVDLIFTDLADRILPDEFTLGGTVLGLIIDAFTPPSSHIAMIFLPPSLPEWALSVAEGLLGGLVTAGLLAFTGKVYELIRRREGLGFGDIKMLLMVGAFLGLPGALFTIFLGSVIGAICGGLYIWRSKEGMTYELPFGSFLGVAALLIGLFGDRMLTWYLALGA